MSPGPKHRKSSVPVIAGDNISLLLQFLCQFFLVIILQGWVRYNNKRHTKP